MPKIGTNQTTPRMAFPQTSLLTSGFGQCRSSPTSRNAVTQMLPSAGTAISRTVDGVFIAYRIGEFHTSQIEEPQRPIACSGSKSPLGFPGPRSSLVGWVSPPLVQQPSSLPEHTTA